MEPVVVKEILSVSLCCLVSLSCASKVKPENDNARVTCMKLAQDGGTLCLVIEYNESTITCCMDGRTDSEFQGRLFTGEHPEHPGARLVNKDDVEIIEAILHLDPKDAPLEQGKGGPCNIIEEFQESTQEIAESHR